MAKDEWIPIWSDLDVHAFIVNLDSDGLDVDDAIGLQRAMGDFDRDHYQLAAIQLLFFDARGYPRTFAPPVVGTFEVIFGEPPKTSPRVDEDMYFDRACGILQSLRQKATRVASNFASAPDEDLAGVIRQLSGAIKDGLYASAVVLSERPTLGLALRRDELLSLVGDKVRNGRDLREFYRFADNWKTVQHDADTLRAMFAAGCGGLSSIIHWGVAQQDPRAMGRNITAIRKGKRLTQADLADLCMRQGKEISVESIGAIESFSTPYKLPTKMHSGSMKLEIVADGLDVELVDVLKWRNDDEIGMSVFAHLLPDIRRRRARDHN